MCVWGDTNSDNKLYHSKLTGNSYELMLLDNHLFADVNLSSARCATTACG